jgi:myo-inositol 2-dehydrogenase/D-chiro-inositol 1-dehydrogenase
MTPAADSRRQFLTTAAAAGAALLPTAVHAAGTDVFKVALVGCGGRGCGAAANALAADPTVRLWAACDVFEDRLTAGLSNLKQQFGDRADVPADRRFAGFDGYKQAIDAGADYVILATPPGFRPLHLAYAVEKDKHVFMEKPHAVDAAGVRSVVESARRAEKKGLGLCGGFVYRYDLGKRDAVARVHAGEIGDVTAIHTTFLTGGLWHRGADPKWSEMEKQVRNWYYYTWLSGDFLVEQAIHNVDKAAWLLKDELPVSATGMGGRQARTDPKYGNIWDHFTVVYEYASGARVFLQCRQMDGCQSSNDNSDVAFGTTGTVKLTIDKHTVTPRGGRPRPAGVAPDLSKAYQTEHEELLRSIKAGKPINDGVRSATSTLMGIMGREAAYTGQKVTWKQMLESKQDLGPKEFAWGPNPVAPVATPGKTKFV